MLESIELQVAAASVNPIKLALKQALETAFHQCATMGVALNDVQRQVLQQVTQTVLLKSLTDLDTADPGDSNENPLAALTESQRQEMLSYVAECDRGTQNWKTTLFSDWLQGQESGRVQFLRDLYGFDWINQVQSHHIAAYAEPHYGELKIGDRLEVSSRLWEWIPEDLDEESEWIICTLISLTQPQDNPELAYGTVQFENGLALEIQGLNDWNKGNWRPVA